MLMIPFQQHEIQLPCRTFHKLPLKLLQNLSHSLETPSKRWLTLLRISTPHLKSSLPNRKKLHSCMMAEGVSGWESYDRMENTHEGKKSFHFFVCLMLFFYSCLPLFAILQNSENVKQHFPRKHTLLGNRVCRFNLMRTQINIEPSRLDG